MAKILRHSSIQSESVRLNRQVQEINFEETCQQELNLELAYEKGFKEGLLAGTTQAYEELKLLKQQLEALINTIPEALETTRHHLSQDIADIVLIISKNYFIERQNNPKALQEQINQILQQINVQQQIELYLHPEDIKQLQAGQIILQAQHLPAIQIKASQDIRLGGCIIKSEHGLFEATIEQQIDQLKEVLIQMKEGVFIAKPD